MDEAVRALRIDAWDAAAREADGPALNTFGGVMGWMGTRTALAWQKANAAAEGTTPGR